MNVYEAQRGMQQADTATRAPQEHETRAHVWAAAKTRLAEAQAKFEAAQKEDHAARAAEEAAWEDLHESSGRIPPRDKPKTMNLDAKVPYYPR